VGSGALSDAELWELISAHDGEAFARLFDRHARRVYNHCFRRTADWALAEDLTSIVFLESWRRRSAVRLSGESVLPWLLAVANNAIRNAERSRRRYRRLLNKLPRVADVGTEETEIARRLDDERAMGEILTLVADLRPEEQDVLSLCDWSGLTIAEAATALGIPAGTVKSRLSRGRERIRRSGAANFAHDVENSEVGFE
jgi:RNA polymerase sigma-70 factor (ECF subfamily)